MSLNDIKILEERIGQKLDDSFVEFLIKYTNAAPVIGNKLCAFNYVTSGGLSNYTIIERVLTFGEILKQLEYTDYLKEYVEHFQFNNNFVEVKYLIPFANTPNGSLLIAFFGLHYGKIYYADSGDFGISFVSKNAESFLSSLYLH